MKIPHALLSLLLLLAREGAALGLNVKVDLFVRNLFFEATAEDVRRAFEPVCAVGGVRVPVDGATGQSRGFAFVTIDAVECDAARRAMDGAVIGGRKITVQLATSNTTPAPRTSNEPRSGKAAAIALNKQLVVSERAADILSLFEDKGADFNYVNYATSLHRLGVLSRSFDKASRPLLQKLVDRATSSIINDSKQWESRHLANACWGIAKIGNIEAPALFEAVAAEALKKMATFTPQNLANTVWAYTTAGVAAPALFDAVAVESSKKIDTFNPQALANTVWAYSAAGVQAPALFEAVAAEAPKRIVTFNAQDLANTVWAFATAGVEAPALFEAVTAEAAKKIATFKPQELANTVWAYATAGVAAPALFEAVATKTPTKIASFDPQALANTVWAYATAGIAAPALFEAVAVESSKKIEKFTPQALANTVWAYATAAVEMPALFEAVAVEAPKKIATFNSQNLGNTVWAYATSGIAAPALFEAVAAEAPKKIETFIPQNLANTVWAYATAGVTAPALFDVLALSIEAQIDEFNLNALSQLHQVTMHLQLEAPQHALTLLLSRHEAELRAAFLRSEPRPSQTQRDVSTALFRIGWAHDFEHVTAEGISLDMAHPASKVAVEFDGPTHYLVGASRMLDGKSKAKERLLRRLGWKLVRVPYFEWMELRSSASRDDYLRDGLEDALRPSRDVAVAASVEGSAPAGEVAGRRAGTSSRLTVVHLRALLKARGLKQAGLKLALLERLEADGWRQGVQASDAGSDVGS